jgi:hypothetical protein
LSSVFACRVEAYQLTRTPNRTIRGAMMLLMSSAFEGDESTPVVAL